MKLTVEIDFEDCLKTCLDYACVFRSIATQGFQS